MPLFSPVNLAVPGPIGGTTPAAITGTTITANTKFVVADGALCIIGATSTTTGFTIGGNFLQAYAGNVRHWYIGGNVMAVEAGLSCSAGISVSPFASGQSTTVGGTWFKHFTTTSTTHTDGTEDDLYSDTLVAFALNVNGDGLQSYEEVSVVSSATATRRIRKYFGGTIIWDSGVLTLAVGGVFSITTSVIRVSATVVRCLVSVTTTSASTVPYTSYTEVTGLTLSNTQILKTTGIAAGTGAASADISDNMEKVIWQPA